MGFGHPPPPMDSAAKQPKTATEALADLELVAEA